MNRRGMTLVEVLVGLMIVALVLAAGYGAFASVIEQCVAGVC
ncbi:MAG: prepilin-type N-terminal cleavage/methylation domain-containing protein [Gemmatimonadetes bacterium]|nr:prepilin-type N-terminal cleavage/methylation domain-containing protein [Gemmatimonadota bacterium]